VVALAAAGLATGASAAAPGPVAGLGPPAGLGPDTLDPPADGRIGVSVAGRPELGHRAAWLDRAAAQPAAAYAPELAASGIPVVALTAYRRAEARMAKATPGCHVRWYLIAGIGRVESDHGRFGGAQLRADGTSDPPIIGVALDGRPGFATIRDTDGGRYDGDTAFDRAVGPMQFIPSSWASYAADGDGDGRADPFNLNDAALAAAAYLCNAGGDLSTKAGQKAAVRSYNHSDEYVALVLALAARYERGVRVGAPPAPGTGTLPPPRQGTLPPVTVGPPPAGTPTHSPAPTPSPSSSPTATRSPTPSPSCPTPTPSPTPSPTGTPTPGQTTGSATSPATAPTTAAAVSSTPSTTSGASTPAATPTTSPTGTPTPTPSPTCG